MTLTQLHNQFYPQFQKVFGEIVTDTNVFKLIRGSDTPMVDFDYLMQVSSVYSSKIEGNSLDINSYFNQVEFEQKTMSKEVVEITNLYTAYQFANDNVLNKKTSLRLTR